MVRDFTPGVDRIATSGSVGLVIGDHAFTGVAGEIRYRLAGGSTIVQVDENGDRHADLEIALNGVFALGSADFAMMPTAGISGTRHESWGPPPHAVAIHLDGTPHLYLA